MKFFQYFLTFFLPLVKTCLSQRQSVWYDYTVLFNGCGRQYVKKRCCSVGKEHFGGDALCCLLFPCQSARDQIFMFPCWTLTPPSSVAFSSAALWRHSPCCTAPPTVSLSLHAARLCYLTFPVSALLRQPFLASFMFWLINYSIGNAKAKSGTECQ